MYWRLIAVKRSVGCFLPALGCNALTEIALRVHESNADKRQPKIARFFTMVSGQDSQPAAINRHGGV